MVQVQWMLTLAHNHTVTERTRTLRMPTSKMGAVKYERARGRAIPINTGVRRRGSSSLSENNVLVLHAPNLRIGSTQMLSQPAMRIPSSWMPWLMRTQKKRASTALWSFPCQWRCPIVINFAFNTFQNWNGGNGEDRRLVLSKTAILAKSLSIQCTLVLF